MVSQFLLAAGTGLVLGLPMIETDMSASATRSELIAPAPALSARGVLQAKQSADIAADISARILDVPFKAGQRFSKDALLVKFDCAQLQAEQEARLEAQKAAAYKYENAAELLAAGAAGELEVTLAKAESRKAVAESKIANTRLKDCNIFAPYAGRVQAKHVSVYDSPPVNSPLISIIRAGAPEIKLIAPSSWLRWARPGTRFEFTIDETGAAFPGKIIRTGAAVDPVSQTIEFTAVFTKSGPNILAGMSGVAKFKNPNTAK